MTRHTKDMLDFLEEGIRMWTALKEKCKDGRQDYGKSKYFRDNPGSILEYVENRCALFEVCHRLGLVGCQGCPNNCNNGCGAFDCAIPEKGIKDRWLDRSG